jgi:hypothetical protein
MHKVYLETDKSGSYALGVHHYYSNFKIYSPLLAPISIKEMTDSQQKKLTLGLTFFVMHNLDVEVVKAKISDRS